MKKSTLVYQIPEIPDPSCTQNQKAAGGNVLNAVGTDFEHLSQTLANMSSGAPSIEITFSFNPSSANKHPQSGLSIYLKAHAEDTSDIESLRLLLERGPLTRFYDFQITDKDESVLSDDFAAACSIVRRTHFVTPLHKPEFNDRIPPYYYSIRQFGPDNSNDYMTLDKVLSGIKEEVHIQLLFQATDISLEQSRHTTYLSRLQQINRTWDPEEDASSGFGDLLTNETPEWRSTRKQTLKPLRYADPLADDILRGQRPINETLRHPHLLFQIVVLAKTPGVARLIGTVLANSAFKDGSYQLIFSHKGEALFNELFRNVKESDIFTPMPHEATFQTHNPIHLYQGMDRLAHIGTVSELTGIFRLPVASISSPRCIRMNTDPPYEMDQDLIVLGIDQEGSNFPMGIALHNLCKHTFISGLSGFGKTNSARNIAIQLHKRGIPFMVIEPVGTEYRILKTLRNEEDENARNLAKALEIYTPGDETISPFRINPLKVPHGISIDEHIDNLLGLFCACMPVAGPIPALLGGCPIMGGYKKLAIENGGRLIGQADFFGNQRKNDPSSSIFLEMQFWWPFLGHHLG
ncbi:MAG: hypothetical protein JRL30_26360 [Deltaproteobacteria bacterium]|nr:hypothetical protein [Deltaproteobacteria bacterium]